MLEVNNKDIDLGKIKFGEANKFFYTLFNNSKKPILIKKIIKGCGSCTEAFCEKTLLSPNETTKLNVIFTPGSTGINRKTIQIMYDYENQPTANLTVVFKADVLK